MVLCELVLVLISVCFPGEPEAWRKVGTGKGRRRTKEEDTMKTGRLTWRVAKVIEICVCPACGEHINAGIEVQAVHALVPGIPRVQSISQ